jgi:hypothetical protein
MYKKAILVLEKLIVQYAMYRYFTVSYKDEGDLIFESNLAHSPPPGTQLSNRFCP